MKIILFLMAMCLFGSCKKETVPPTCLTDIFITNDSNYPIDIFIDGTLVKTQSSKSTFIDQLTQGTHQIKCKVVTVYASNGYNGSVTTDANCNSKTITVKD